MSIRIDWLHLHFTPFDSVLGDAEFMPFVNVECPVKTVEIRGLRYPSPMILKAFTAPFLHMTALELECLRIWCGLCHTCTLVRFSFPRPTGFLYEGGLGLPVCEFSFKFRNQISSFIGTLFPRSVFLRLSPRSYHHSSRHWIWHSNSRSVRKCQRELLGR